MVFYPSCAYQFKNYSQIFISLLLINESLLSDLLSMDVTSSTFNHKTSLWVCDREIWINGPEIPKGKGRLRATIFKSADTGLLTALNEL